MSNISNLGEISTSGSILSGEAATQALEEYKSLRAEILQNEKVCTELLGLTLASTGVMFGLGITNKACGVFLVTLPLLWAMYYYVTDKRRAAYAASQYISVFLEPHLPGLNRETRRINLKRAQPVVPGERGVVVDWVVFNGLRLSSLCLFAYYSANRYDVIIPALVWAGLKIIENLSRGRSADLTVGHISELVICGKALLLLGLTLPR